VLPVARVGCPCFKRGNKGPRVSLEFQEWPTCSRKLHTPMPNIQQGWSWINISGVSHSNLSWAPLPGPRAQRGVFVRATLEARGLLSTMNPRIFYPIVLDYNDYMEALARKVQEVLDAAEAPFTLLAPTPSQTHPTRSISTTLAQLDPAPHHPTNFGHPHDDVPHHKLPQNFGGFAFGFGGVGFGGSAAA
jgi:hypothetical protein